MVNVVQALVLTQGDKMVLTPTYYIFDMYKVHQDAHLLVLKLNSPYYAYEDQKVPAVNASASRDSLGAVHISLVNVDASKPVTIRASLQGLPSKSIQGQILTADKVNDINDFDKPAKVFTKEFSGARKEGEELVVTLPARSVVMLELK
jgi:alpha-N-arabinofuranosidase